MEIEAAFNRLTSHLYGKNKEAATGVLRNLLSEFARLSIHYGNPFFVDERQLASNAGVNRETVQKWIPRLININLLSCHSKGGYQKGASTYSFLGYPPQKYMQLSEQLEQLTLQEIYSPKNCFANTEDPEKEKDEFVEKKNSSSVAAQAISTFNKLVCGGYPNSDGLLDDLPDIEEEPEVSQWGTSKGSEKKGKRSSILTQRNARRGTILCSRMYEQCVQERKRGGRYQYPIHPDIYCWLGNPEAIRINCYSEGGILLPEFRYLWQPPKEDRPICPRCEKEGKKRRCRLYMLRTPHHFGAVKYRCDLCHWLGDLWKEFPVYGKPPSLDVA